MADFTFVDGNAPTASNWNTNVRDQLFVIATSATRPAAPVTGRVIYETDTGREMRYDGSVWQQVGQLGAWTTYTPTWTASSNPAIGNGTISGRYQLIQGKTLLVYVTITTGSTTTFGSGAWAFGLPGSYSFKTGQFGGQGYVASATTPYPCHVIYNGASTFQMAHYSVTGSTVYANGVSATAPFSWTNANVLYAALSAEIN